MLVVYLTTSRYVSAPSTALQPSDAVAARLAAGGLMGYSQVAKRQGGQERVARQRADVVVRHVPETITTTSHTPNYLSKSSINILKYFDNDPSIKSWLCTYICEM